jgi:hypothetical protein
MSKPDIDQEQPLSEAPPVKRRFGRVVLRTIGVLFFLIVFGFFFANQVPLDLAFHLLVGWLRFLWKMLPLMQINTGLILSSVLASGVALWLLHRVVMVLRANRGGNSRWTIRQTVAIAALILMLFGAVLAGTGMGYQFVWLKQDWELTTAGTRAIYEKSKVSFARNVWTVLKEWAEAHNGRYPASLHELMPEYIDDAKTFSWVYFWSPVHSGPHEPWIYLGESLTTAAPGHLPLLVSPRPFFSGRYAVCRNDGSVASETPENYRKALADWRAYSSKHSPQK